jgi:uncharacterized repeat protein (TIGR03803 family)
MSKLNWGKSAYAAFLLCATTAIALPAQTFTTLHSFDHLDGVLPYAGLVQATNGKFYGTAYYGGANTCIYGSANVGCGTVFEITPSGKLTTLYSFCSQSDCTDGSNPYGGLIQATDGNLYGTTVNGGANTAGTVFKITPSGKLTTLYSSCSQSNCADGANPYAALVQATDGNLYGTTVNGGAIGFYDGTVFKITPSGKLTTLHSFCSHRSCADGYNPYAALVQATDGKLYGTTVYGGDFGWGTVFKITRSGTLTRLYSFPGGTVLSSAALIQATDGNF